MCEAGRLCTTVLSLSWLCCACFLPSFFFRECCFLHLHSSVFLHRHFVSSSSVAKLQTDEHGRQRRAVTPRSRNFELHIHIILELRTWCLLWFCSLIAINRKSRTIFNHASTTICICMCRLFLFLVVFFSSSSVKIRKHQQFVRRERGSERKKERKKDEHSSHLFSYWQKAAIISSVRHEIYAGRNSLLSKMKPKTENANYH